MNHETTPDQQLAGTDTTAEHALELIGDDPETLVLAIRLLDRMAHSRCSRRTKGDSTISY